MSTKNKKENPPLVFDFGSGKFVKIYANCDEWYLVDKGKDPGVSTTKRTYLNNDWFFQTLKDNRNGIFKFASLFRYECNFESGSKMIKNYIDEFEKETGPYGMDTTIYMMEVFAQSATKNPDIHWW